MLAVVAVVGELAISQETWVVAAAVLVLVLVLVQVLILVLVLVQSSGHKRWIWGLSQPNLCKHTTGRCMVLVLGTDLL
jgi:hypothetical protein